MKESTISAYYFGFCESIWMFNTLFASVAAYLVDGKDNLLQPIHLIFLGRTINSLCSLPLHFNGKIFLVMVIDNSSAVLEKILSPPDMALFIDWLLEIGRL